jgi:orotidine-5'-phosphate decarboxylase
VALDFADPARCLELARATAFAGAQKIGLTAFTAGGSDLVRDVSALSPVFLDLKLHDIPAQVAGAVTAIADLGVAYTTVHATGGEDMLRAAAEAADEHTTVLAVTVLTSLSDEDLQSLGVGSPARDQVLRLADLALAAGVRGLVCSPQEVDAIRSRFGPRSEGGPTLVVPGIRPLGAASNDQKRTLGPREAVDAGADLLVIGRPITAATDPALAARTILSEMES